MLKNNFPLYIPSKGRSEYMVTSRVLTEMGLEHFVVVEPQEVEKYKKAVKEMKLLATIIELDMSYKDKYELCDDLGLTRSTGPGPARNFAWDHSISLGYTHHWVMDDNIRSFRRFNKNEKVKMIHSSFFRIMEDFCLRYTNVAMAGPNYYMFASARTKMRPIIMNTRIYSCNFIKNSCPQRWRGRYNEDTIISIDMLKAGYCTVQFNTLLQEKMNTQTLKGGNTQEFYHKEGIKNAGDKYADNGTLAKSQMQVRVHPDISKLVWKFGRWHHTVDYSGFKKNKLLKRKDIEEKEGGDSKYGIKLVQR